MIKNFEELKKQLEKLSSVINSFKSESVQLRIVELIFRGEINESDEEFGSSATPQRKSSRRRKKASRSKGAAKDKQAKSAPKKKATGGKKGSATILGELIDEGFFQSKRAIKDIIEHADSQKARTFKANEISGPLTRFVRDKRLKRQKNSDGQYEYYK